MQNKANTHMLKPKTQAIYDAICNYYAKNGYPPAVREIAEMVGLKSSSTVKHHLDKLVAQGFLKRTEGRSRALEIADLERAESQLTKTENEADYSQQMAAANIANFADFHSAQVSVPLVGEIAAGIPITAEQAIEETFSIPQRFTGSGELFMLRVKGDSMIDAAICDGDWVIVRQQQTANFGEIVAAMIDGEATVKTLSRKDGHIWLLPANSNFAPIPGDQAQILGKVVTVLRSL